jgi:hypothetical protein
VLQHHVSQRGEGEGALGRIVTGRQKDPSADKVGHRPRRLRQVGHRVQGEAEAVGDRIHSMPGQRPAVVINADQQLISQFLDGREVVVRRPHPGPQISVGSPRIFRGAVALRAVRSKLIVQGHQRLQRIQREARSSFHRREPQFSE